METNPLFAVEDSDSEVFDGSSPSDHTLAPSASLAARTNSSSSSRKSSYEDLGGDDKRPASVLDHAPMEMSMSTNPSTPPTMVEWKPRPQDEVAGGDSPRHHHHHHHHHHQAQNGYRAGSNSDGGVASPPTPQEDLKALYGSAVTVTIDPPRDDGNDEVTSYLEGGRGDATPPPAPEGGDAKEEENGGRKHRSLADLFDGESDEEGKGKGEEFDLFKDLDDMDLSEEDESEPPPPTKICLLSKYVLVL